jgi:hypothetical protein
MEAAAPPIVNPIKDPIIPIAPPPSNLRPILTGGRRLRRAIYVPRPHVNVPTYFISRLLRNRRTRDTVAEIDIHLYPCLTRSTSPCVISPASSDHCSCAQEKGDIPFSIRFWSRSWVAWISNGEEGTILLSSVIFPSPWPDILIRLSCLDRGVCSRMQWTREQDRVFDWKCGWWRFEIHKGGPLRHSFPLDRSGQWNVCMHESRPEYAQDMR